MSDILCKWLNEELRLSKTTEPTTFAKNFSNGYLIGEVLHKYQLQTDFSMFMKKETSVSKLNNFTRLEPTLQLLGISFDINTAQDLMQEKQGAATRLLYQLYVSLEKKKTAEISGTVMEIMQPLATAGLHKKERDIYSDRLHQVVKCDADLKLQKISEHYEEKCPQWSDRSATIYPVQQSRTLKGQNEIRKKNIEKMCRQKHRGILTYNQAAVIQVPRPPPYTSQSSLKKKQHQQQQQRREQQAQRVQTEIDQFETNRKKVVSYGSASSSGGDPLGGSSHGSGSGNKLVLQSNSKYIQEIRQRLEESAHAREQREKRRNRFLVEQLKAHEAQEEAQREEQLVKRLTRQTQQEQRLAAQLLQMHKQKEVIRENRLFREQQYRQRRERDFQEALEREAALAQQAKLEGAAEIRKELEFCSRMAAERAQHKYKKHFMICKDIMEQIVDLTTKVGEYRLLTGNLIPEKVMREWKELLLNGLPLYGPFQGQQPGFGFTTPLDPVELKKQEILKNQDYDDYTNMVGEWEWHKEAGEAKLPLTNNNILGHVVQRVRNIVHPTIKQPSSPSFPNFTLKACVLGKFCSGKTTCLAKIAKAHGLYVLSADTLIEKTMNAHKNREEVSEQQEDEVSEQQQTSSTLLKPDLDSQEESRISSTELSTQAKQGAAAEMELSKGNAIANELIVDIIVEAIRQVPAGSGWILDGFPTDINQAHLLEQALGGSVDVRDDAVSSKTDLATDPNPPKPLPPPAPALDLALLLDLPDESVVTRAYSQTDVESAVTSSLDKTMLVAQTPHRITAFQETWSKLEKWFDGKQNILVRVDADVDEEELYKRVETALLQLIAQKREVQDEAVEILKAPDPSSSATPSPVDRPTSSDKDKALSCSDSFSSLKENKGLRDKSLSKSSPNSPRGNSRRSSTSSLTKELPASASSLPGSPAWVYVDEPLPPEIPECLCAHWAAVCDSYVNNIKTVLLQIHSQRSFIDPHLFNIREEYQHYLSRPDMKQELVSQWQKDFNSIANDMREDEDTKAELHLRFDELLERLWDISDKCMEENKQEKTAKGEGWVENHSAVLINSHSMLIQVELDRFKETLCILRVYYLSMSKNVLPELPSNFVCIPLLDKDQDESSEPAGRGVCSQGEDGGFFWKSKFVPFLPKRPDSSVELPEEKDLAQTELVKPPSEKLISDCEEALTAISKLVAEDVHQVETKEEKEKPAEKKPNDSTSAKKKGNRMQSAKKTKGPPTPPAAPSPAPAEDSEMNLSKKVRKKIHKEYAAAVSHEEDTAKMRIALVKDHGLMMLQSLYSRAEQTLSSMEKWLQAHYLAEMKSIDQLIEVVRHHIETGTKLQKELVLDFTDFYLNGDHHMVANPAPPPRPSPLEKQIQSTCTITQLESLQKQLYSVAPSGLISSSEFSSLLMDIISVNVSQNILPNPWNDTSEAKLMEIVSLLMDNLELIDWRRFLLSAALPWPFPSLSQLLAVLKHFKEADTGSTGYINEEQYQQTELWFSKESVQLVPEDPSEPLPFDRLANLHKFFFQLFADRSISPPKLDYVSMLLYFAADPNPKEGFIRALSVVSGLHLRDSSTDHLVKSMPSIEEATELSTSDVDGGFKQEETHPCASSSSLEEQGVSISTLLSVICHKVTKIKNGNTPFPRCPSQQEYTEQLMNVFRELGYEPEDCVPFAILSQHLFIQELMEKSTQHQLVNIHKVLLPQPDEGESDSVTVS